MSIEELTDIVPPPENPLNAGPAEKWDAVCNELGTKLPSDLRDLALTYGSGHFVQRIMVFNPFDEAYPLAVQQSGDHLHDFVASQEWETPYRVYPESPGLLALGNDDQNGNMWWLTDGHPDDWSIVLRPRDGLEGDFWRLDMPLTRFLTLTLSKWFAIHSLWSHECFDHPDTRRFTPKALGRWYHEPVESKSAYELYRENGNKVGFFLQFEIHSAGGYPVIYYITSIGGLTQGDLPGDPPEYDNAIVIADEYDDGQLTARDYVIERPHVKKFRRHSPPEGWDAQRNA